jgi:uncharacterized protein YdhG (YjbR/CyaY superfamily)
VLNSIKNNINKKRGIMESNKKIIKSIDEYILNFPEDVQKKLIELREVIKANAPGAEEKISYQMPTFTLNGNLVYFAAFKKHIGFYPIPSGIEEFRKELSAYEQGKGSIRFPIDEPLPLDLIRKIVKFRVRENLAKSESKKKK